MPIYAYKCSSCGFEKDVLQKMSDKPLSVCPSCHAAAFEKQVTAAGFRLKGTGWYVTDFRGGKDKGGADSAGGTHAGSSDGASAAPAPAPAPAPAASSTADAAAK